MSIHDRVSKIKGKLRMDNLTFLYLFVVLGVGISSFGLGRLSVIQSDLQASAVTIIGGSGKIQSSSSNLANTKVVSSSPSSSVVTIETGSRGNYLASKNGKLYYTAGCKAANRIKPENIIWFDTASDAEKSGLTRSTSCK